jgi:hypothetical protein
MCVDKCDNFEYDSNGICISSSDCTLRTPTDLSNLPCGAGCLLYTGNFSCLFNCPSGFFVKVFFVCKILIIFIKINPMIFKY